MIRRYVLTTLICALLSVSVSAQNYMVNVHGIVCELCSFGVAKNIRKLPFINPEQYDDGVKVDINNQIVFVSVRADATLEKKALFEAIEKGGYNPVKLWELSDSGERTEIVE